MATADEIKIRIIAKDEASKVFQQTKSSANSLKSAMFALKASIVASSVAGGALLQQIIKTGSQVENLKVRMRFLTGSTKQGAAAFQAMSKYASKVPFALEDIQAGVPSLLTVSSGTEQLNELLQITGDLAAASGLSFGEASMQMQRALAGGIASAELFRERGISAMLGFEAGVSYSAEQTRDKITAAFRDGTTTVAGAANELANTFTGQVSMMQDAWFQLKKELAEAGVLKEATRIVMEITKGIKDPSFQEGMKSFTTNMLDLFKFMVNNSGMIVRVMGAVAGAKLGSVFGKKGAIAGAIAGAVASDIDFVKKAIGGLTPPDIKDMSIQELETMKNATIPQAQAELLRGNGDLEYKTSQMVMYERQIELINKELSLRKPLVVLTEKQRQKVVGLNEAIEGQVAKLTTQQEIVKGVAAGIDQYTGSIKNLEKESAAVAVKGMKSLEDAMVDMMMGAKSAKDAFKDMAKSIVADIVRIYVRRQLLGGIMGMGGGAGIGDWFSAASGSTYNTGFMTEQSRMLAAQNLSFAGGGYTGAGARSGGMDGKGGFMAMLHPNETVIDHAAGQGMTQPVVVNFNINAIDTVTGSQFLAGNKPMIVGMIAEAMNRRGNRSTV